MPDESATMKPIVFARVVVSLLALACTTGASGADPHGSTALSNGSALADEGSATVLYGALSVAAAATMVVKSVDTAGDASVVVLAGASDAARATVRLSGRAAREASLVAGASVNVVAMSTGYLLVAGGKVLAFFPNEIGKALIHHARRSGRG